MSFWMKKHLWEYEVNDVRSVYPDAKWVNVYDEGNKTRAWLVNIDPIPYESDLLYVIADLDRGMDIDIGQNGKIYHSSSRCRVPLEDHQVLLPKLALPQQRYKVQLTYRGPRKMAIASTQPKTRILDPEISYKTFPLHPHMYRGKQDDSWACPLSPQLTKWEWGAGATVMYLDQVAIWLLKTAIWIVTGAGIAGLGKWIGPDTPHDKLHLIRDTGLSNPCWCGSGIAYRNCHFKSDSINGIINQFHNIRQLDH